MQIVPDNEIGAAGRAKLCDICQMLYNMRVDGTDNMISFNSLWGRAL